MKRPAPALLSQVLALNALLVLASLFVASVAAGLDLGVPVERRNFMVLALAILVTLLGNGFLLRRRFEPLERIVDTMAQVDLSAPGLRVPPSSADSREVARLHDAFNRMLARLEAERREAGRAVLRAQEEERRRVAQDLHDEVNQALTAVLLRLEASIGDAPPVLARELEETKRLANRAMDELLVLARQLRPAALDDHGLLPALQAQISDFGRRTGIRTSFHRRGDVPPLSDEQQTVIYRVAQESLSNIAQHAGATRVDVELSFIGGTLLSIRDDGCGFSDARPGGLGLSGMRERALLVGGKLTIDSGAGRGTIVELTMD